MSPHKKVMQEWLKKNKPEYLPTPIGNWKFANDIQYKELKDKNGLPYIALCKKMIHIPSNEITWIEVQHKR